MGFTSIRGAKMNKKLLLSYIEKIKRGINPESVNLDFKKEWWDFKSRPGVEEFVKDICSMANTSGGDSHIVIGVDEKSGSLHDSPLPIDEAKLQDKHKNKVQPLIRVHFREHAINDGGDVKKISVVVIPHSTRRPHVITRINNKPDHIPIRLGTQTIEASRADLDAMYSERRKTSKLKVKFLEEKLEWGNYSYYNPAFLMRLEFDNHSGEMSEHIEKIKLVSKSAIGNPWETKHFKIEENGKDLGLDAIFQVGSEEIRHVIVYVSEKTPQNSGYRENLPGNDKDQYKLIIQTRSGTEITPIEIPSGWVTNN